MKTIIVGGVAAGASAAARLRRLDENANIIIFERGEYISYANCGLPYYIGGDITDESELTLQTPKSFYNRFNIDVRINSTVIGVDTEQKSVTVVKNESGESYTESYDKLILSPGAEPLKPRWTAVNSPRVFTLRNIPDTFKIKRFIEEKGAKSAAIIGGGYIGVEMAESLTKAGLKVTIIEMADHIIAPLDYDMACDVHHYLHKKGVDVKLSTAVSDLKESEHGIEIELPCKSFVVDMVLLSIGVKPDSGLAKNAGLAVSAKGAILVDENMQTSQSDIYAVGDAIEIVNFVSGLSGYIPLAGPANKQGRIVADNICGIKSSFSGTQGSAVAKIFDMTVATTGLNETGANTAGIKYDKVYTFSSSHASYYPNATSMSVKLIYEKPSGKIIGAQIVGFDGVDKRCDVIATAIRGKMTVSDLTELELCYAPPFSSAKDPVNMAGFTAENVLSGLVKQYFWSDVAALQKRNDIIMLDVRTDKEFERGHIDKTVHIPVDSLRARMDELDKTKPIYVNCQSGLRSYIACRILTQNGFECYNLAGGYRLYESVTRDMDFDETPKHACGISIK